MVDFRAIIDNLGEMGFFSVILPFLLVYVVVYGILEKAGIFKAGEGKQVKNINSIIAFVFALFAVASIQTVMYLQNVITIVVTFIIFILVVLILLGFIFGDQYMQLLMNDGKLRQPMGWVIAGIVVLACLVVLLMVTGAWDWLMNWWDNTSFIDSDTLWSIIVLVVIGGVIVWVTKSD